MEMRNETVVGYNAEQVYPVFNARICLKGDRSTGKQLSNVTEVSEYLRDVMSDYATETLMVVAVDMQCRVLCTAVVGVGSLSSVDVDIASVAKVALLSNARAIFLSHNHPGGTCRPSAEDINATLRIQKALSMFSIDILDHIIVCPNGDSYSMKQHGDF